MNHLLFRTKQRIKQVVKKALLTGMTPTKLALSFAVGIYIAFSPFIGFHFLMILGASYAFGLNFSVMFIAATFNNPWTMIPFYTSGYAFGYWFIHYLLGCNPVFVISLERLFGSGKICFLSYLVGGNILGVVAAVVSYPIMAYVFTRLAARYQTKSIS